MSKLKIKPEHYEVLKNAFQDLNKQMNLDHVKSQYMTTGHTELRFRWDMFWYIKMSGWVCRELYPYLTDDHIDSALRKIFEELGV
ncbi:MAG TPA: hypothetical protein VFM18_24190 [Methanosarcina sp.]|nr:hypothetical protein [Methanosarcina sp.]